MSTTPTEFERRLGGAFSDSGFELFVVGGAIRDQFLGKEVRELDFATDALPSQTVCVLEGMGGLSMYRLGEKFGTIGAVAGGVRAEITTYRSSERYAAGSRKPQVVFGKTLEQDLSRRDFTINAIARRAGADSEPDVCVGATQHREPGSSLKGLVDPFGGLADLRSRRLRAVGDPDERFREDPLRLLRGVRFAAAFDLALETNTLAAMKASVELLAQISRERIAEEMNRVLVGPAPVRAMSFLKDTGMLRVSLPELSLLDSMSDHGPRHPLSLWDHTMRVLAAVSEDQVTRWAALLHDIAKPETRCFDDEGRIRFPRHEVIGAEKADGILKSLRMSTETIKGVHDLIETHMQFHQYTTEWSDGAVRRLTQRLGPNFERAIDLARADASGHGDTSWGMSMVDALASRARDLSEALPEARSPLDGRELMEHYGRNPGPWIGRIKDALTEMVVEGELAVEDKTTAWQVADRVAEESTA